MNVSTICSVQTVYHVPCTPELPQPRAALPLYSKDLFFRPEAPPALAGLSA